MVKLISYTRERNRTICDFEKNQWVKFWSFGEDIYSETSEGITKESVKDIKQQLLLKGLDANLYNFIGHEYKEYGE